MKATEIWSRKTLPAVSPSCASIAVTIAACSACAISPRPSADNDVSVINAIVMFLIVAFVCFLIVKQINKMKVEKEEVASGPSETDLLAEIRDAIKANND